MEFKMIGALLEASRDPTGNIDMDRLTTSDTRRSRANLLKQMEAAGIHAGNMRAELEKALLMVELDHEEQGFINGFRMGVQLMRECTRSVAGGAARQ